ncbi:hypothetical protein SAMN04487895_101785 [Paenibacillus sophorae]|uniref:Uncharacterized protein n=1 Tax=Paenibacillus sophorae TaxID=1333845 RepID=A0A1H8H858_9BACL|nr:hypothetical protein SAMN04487895_101785 [Paenibacillus sophorae]
MRLFLFLWELGVLNQLGQVSIIASALLSKCPTCAPPLLPTAIHPSRSNTEIKLIRRV